MWVGPMGSCQFLCKVFQSFANPAKLTKGWRLPQVVHIMRVALQKPPPSTSTKENKKDLVPLLSLFLVQSSNMGTHGCQLNWHPRITKGFYQSLDWGKHRENFKKATEWKLVLDCSFSFCRLKKMWKKILASCLAEILTYLQESARGSFLLSNTWWLLKTLSACLSIQLPGQHIELCQ